MIAPICVALAASLLLAAAPISAAPGAVKGAPQRLEEAKGGRLELTQQPLAEQQKLEELPAAPAAPAAPQLPQKEEQLSVAAPATKGLRYEARPQVSREELSKTRYEQKQQDEVQREQAVDLQQQQQQFAYHEAKQEEQRKLDELPLQQAEEITQQRELTQQREVYETKGVAAGGAAPLGEAEPYAFSYQVDGSTRSESGDSRGVVRGQYTLQGQDGSSRVVDYVADHNGFRAAVSTNEFGTEPRSPANVALRSSQPYAEDITLRLEGKTREDLIKASPVPLRPVVVAAAPAVPLATLPVVPAPAPVPVPVAPLPVPVPLLREAVPQPIKGRLVQAEELPVQHREEQLEYPAKSAESRAAKSIDESRAAKSVVRASGFESATAHRAPRVQAPVAPAPVVRSVASVRAPIVGVARAPVATVSRVYPVRGERYPPSPVHSVAHRQRYVYAQPEPPVHHPRVSFYGSAADEELHSFAEQPAEIQ